MTDDSDDRVTDWLPLTAESDACEAVISMIIEVFQLIIEIKFDALIGVDSNPLQLI